MVSTNGNLLVLSGVKSTRHIILNDYGEYDMNNHRLLIIFLSGLLLLLAACTAISGPPASTATPPSEVPLVEPTTEADQAPTDEPEATSHGNETVGLVELVDALRAASHVVEPAGAVQQPFFSAEGQVISVDGSDVQVFEYPEAETAAAESVQIAPGAGSVGTSMITWVATPHFYAKDRLIVLYVGDDEAVVGALNEVLGEPVAEGQGSMLPPGEG